MKKFANTLKVFTLAAAMLASANVFTHCSSYTPTEKDLPVETLTSIATIYPKAAFVEMTGTSSYIVKDAKGRTIGSVQLSSPYSDDIKGFNGPTPLQIAFDKNGKIVEVRVLDNEETPNFLKRVVDAGFLESWNGLSAEEALAKDVDAVSGATYSSNGIQKSLKAGLQAVKH
ncbi:MAG: FMN-binding protein [Bacteroidales bacterium]|nr:FMN-binding protein [Bacteroidales bacterium]